LVKPQLIKGNIMNFDFHVEEYLEMIQFTNGKYSEFNFQWSTLNSLFYNLRASANSKIISPK
jgi:uncharacterized protein with NRDE domain